MAHTISSILPFLAPAPRIFDSFLHTSTDEGNIGTARTPSWEMKTGLNYCRIKQVLNTVQHKDLWKEVTFLFSPPFPTAYLTESSPDSCALCRTQRAWQSMWGVIWRQTVLGFLPSGDTDQRHPFGDGEQAVSAKPSLSCQAVKELKGDVTVGPALSNTSTSAFPGI